MAKCMEDLGEPKVSIKEVYMKALECAQSSGNKKAEVNLTSYTVFTLSF